MLTHSGTVVYVRGIAPLSDIPVTLSLSQYPQLILFHVLLDPSDFIMMISSPHRLGSPGPCNFTVTISSPKSLSSSLRPDDFIVKLSLPHPPRPPRPSDLNLIISLPHPPEPEDFIVTISSFFSWTPPTLS